jgi:beta-fructofuranosidase
VGLAGDSASAHPGTHTHGASVPECADLFAWNGWYYLVFGMGLRTHYRIAQSADGPWLRPRIDVLDSQFCAVMKTAPFGNNRRIGVGWAARMCQSRR